MATPPLLFGIRCFAIRFQNLRLLLVDLILIQESIDNRLGLPSSISSAILIVKEGTGGKATGVTVRSHVQWPDLPRHTAELERYRVPVATIAESLIGSVIDVLTEELNRTINQQEVCTTGML